jgi:hypothetical protein
MTRHYKTSVDEVLESILQPPQVEWFKQHIRGKSSTPLSDEQVLTVLRTAVSNLLTSGGDNSIESLRQFHCNIVSERLLHVVDEMGSTLIAHLLSRDDSLEIRKFTPLQQREIDAVIKKIPREPLRQLRALADLMGHKGESPDDLIRTAIADIMYGTEIEPPVSPFNEMIKKSFSGHQGIICGDYKNLAEYCEAMMKKELEADPGQRHNGSDAVLIIADTLFDAQSQWQKKVIKRNEQRGMPPSR